MLRLAESTPCGRHFAGVFGTRTITDFTGYRVYQELGIGGRYLPVAASQMRIPANTAASAIRLTAQSRVN
ncbi:MAG: hypothetical protein JWN63_3022 [Candidatus Acidoferrum typicum]|nr:hypothetical protein [Candidatus Acidoferrum typicum]